MKISELMDGVRKQDLVMPEFQREYVWSREQAKQLMVSLLKSYPVGGLLFWKTDTPPDLKNVTELPDKLGTVQVILDGQQRITTLHLLVTGDIPSYYTESDIQTDPRDLYFNLENGDFQYFQTSRMRGNLLWKSVVECFNNTAINVFEIAKENTEEDNEQSAFDLAQKYNDMLTKLRSIRDIDLPVQTVPPHASLDEAIDIFDRVNSQGTKLTDAELALTHITGKWSAARRVMKEKIDDLSTQHFYFDLTFATRALTGVVTKRALFETIHESPKEDLENGWAKLSKILDYMVNILPQRAFIHSTEDLNTTNLLVPIVAYLSQHDGKFPDEKSLKNALHWLYAAHMWARYTAQTDQRLEHDIVRINREPNPWEALRAQIIDQRGRIEVKANDFEGRGVQHPFFRTMYILAKAHGAVDWFNGAQLGTTHGSAYTIHRHHIFPQSVLKDNGYDGDNHLHRKIINEIANRAFLTADTNWDISNRLPEEYLPEVEDKYPGALTSQFIPMDPALWKTDKYEDFLEVRRNTVAKKINEFMDSLISEPEVTHQRPVSQLIELGESTALEFKSTLQWDVVQNQQNKNLRQSVLKTIGAFLNTDGGTLVIGVEDRGEIYGLDNDLKTLNHSLDKFEQLLSSLITEHIGPEFTSFIKTRFENVDDKKVCIIDTDKAPEPAFVKGPKGKEFYVRVGNTTRALDPQETMRFVEMNWN